MIKSLKSILLTCVLCLYPTIGSSDNGIDKLGRRLINIASLLEQIGRDDPKFTTLRQRFDKLQDDFTRLTQESSAENQKKTEKLESSINQLIVDIKDIKVYKLLQCGFYESDTDYISRGEYINGGIDFDLDYQRFRDAYTFSFALDRVNEIDKIYALYLDGVGNSESIWRSIKLCKFRIYLPHDMSDEEKQLVIGNDTSKNRYLLDSLDMTGRLDQDKKIDPKILRNYIALARQNALPKIEIKFTKKQRNKNFASTRGFADETWFLITFGFGTFENKVYKSIKDGLTVQDMREAYLDYLQSYNE